jgi:hypothetical protein
VFWVAVIAAQYYFLYRKFDAVRACRDQHARVDKMQTQVDSLKTLMDRRQQGR